MSVSTLSQERRGDRTHADLSALCVFHSEVKKTDILPPDILQESEVS